MDGKEKRTIALFAAVTVVFLAAFLRVVTKAGDENDLAAIGASCICSEVSIVANNAVGSGTIILEDEASYIVVSAAHLLETFDENSTVTLSDGTVLSGVLLAFDGQEDVGFLRLEKPEEALTAEEALSDHTRDPKAATYHIEAVKELTYGDIIWTFNTAQELIAGTFAERGVVIEDLGDSLMYLILQAEDGMSGRGVYNEEGEYVGMVLGGSDKAQVGAMTSDTIYQMYHILSTEKKEGN